MNAIKMIAFIIVSITFLREEGEMTVDELFAAAEANLETDRSAYRRAKDKRDRRDEVIAEWTAARDRLHETAPDHPALPCLAEALSEMPADSPLWAGEWQKGIGTLVVDITGPIPNCELAMKQFRAAVARMREQL